MQTGRLAPSYQASAELTKVNSISPSTAHTQSRSTETV